MEAYQNKISVIMPSYLGYYPNCADDRERKFERAVNSFLQQSHKRAELIIISDGCDKTDLLFQTYFKDEPSIIHHRIEKQPIFSGNVRQAGLEMATGDLVCYLDTDDMFGRNHLSNINSCFPQGHNFEWAFYNDFLYASASNHIPKIVSLEKGSIGTSSIVHLTSLRDKGLSWTGCDKYNHDWLFVERLMKFSKHKKIFGCAYFICHIPDQINS